MYSMFPDLTKQCRNALIGLIAAALSACAAVGPDYIEPELSVPDAWHMRIVQQVQQGPDATLQTWWTVFDDPVLNELIDRARLGNLDLRTAASRVAAARSGLAITRGERLPTVDGTGQTSRTRQSDDGWLAQVAPNDGFDAQNLYELGLDASWEIDLFGRVRRSIESSQAQYESTVEAERDVMVTLFAEVAMTYIEVREMQRRVEYATQNISVQREALGLAQERYDTGLSSQLDVVQAKATLGMTEAALPDFETAKNQALFRLAVLLGQDAGSLQGEFAAPAAIPSPVGRITLGLPVDVVRQRPDVRSAERRLAAQTAQIGVATAALYPSFTLSGFIGLQSRSVNDLFSSNSEMWGASLPFSWNLFDGGRVRSNIELQKELTETRLLEYRQAVLEALAEVESALVAYNNEQEKLAALRRATAATVEGVRLAMLQYDTGLTDYNNVMTMQRDLFQLQDQLAASEAQLDFELIALYKAVGGGW
jgi:NodT family efflux transporter outer membrane factor (OMF) lipoprotein